VSWRRSSGGSSGIGPQHGQRPAGIAAADEQVHREAVDERVEAEGLLPQGVVGRAPGEPLHQAEAGPGERAIGLVADAGEPGERGRLGDQGDVDLQLRAAVRGEGKQLAEHVERVLARISDGQRQDTRGRAVDHELGRELEELGARGEEVAQGTHRDAGLGGDRADGHGADPALDDHAPDGLRELGFAGVPVDRARHGRRLARAC